MTVTKQHNHTDGVSHPPTKMWPAIVAWVGVVAVLLASLPTFNISREWMLRPETAGRITEGVFVSVFLGVIGILPALVGGFIARSRRASWAIIAARAVYLLVFLPWAMLDRSTEWLFGMPPGIVCVTCGSALPATRHRGWWFALAALVSPVVAFVGGIAILGMIAK